jgi:hypothetical protein
VWFVAFYFEAGRRWLAWTVSGLRALYLLVGFLLWGNVNYLEITRLRRVPFLGDAVTAFEGVPNPWMLFGYATMVLILIFVADASVTAWRRGQRREALTIGGSIEFFLLIGTVEAALVHWARLPIPVLIAPFYLGLVVVMAFALSRDVLRASRLVHELQASEAGLRESEAHEPGLDAADLGIGSGRRETRSGRATDGAELFGFAPSGTARLQRHPTTAAPGRSRGLRQVHAMAFDGADGGHYQIEYRRCCRTARPGGFPPGPCRVRRHGPAGPDPWRCSRRDRAQTGGAGDTVAPAEIAHAGRVSMMGQLASGLAHEINQPLASILATPRRPSCSSAPLAGSR